VALKQSLIKKRKQNFIQNHNPFKEKIKIDFVHISVEEVLFSVGNEKLAKAITIIEQLVEFYILWFKHTIIPVHIHFST